MSVSNVTGMVGLRAQGAQTLIDYARRNPETQLMRLTRLIDPLLKLRKENMCEASQLNCTFASRDLYRVRPLATPGACFGPGLPLTIPLASRLERRRRLRSGALTCVVDTAESTSGEDRIPTNE